MAKDSEITQAIDKLKSWGAAGWEKAKESSRRAADKLAKVELRSEQTTATVIMALGSTVGPMAGAYAAGRLIDPEHDKVVAAVGGTLALVGGVVALAEPEYASYAVSMSAFFAGPAIRMAGNKGADDRAEAHANAPAGGGGGPTV